MVRVYNKISGLGTATDFLIGFAVTLFVVQKKISEIFFLRLAKITLKTR